MHHHEVLSYYQGVHMPSLQVRDLPEHVYRKLIEIAALENRSIAQETIVLLEKALGMETKKKTRRKQLIEKILRTAPIAEPQKIPDPVGLLRQDRSR
jgi:plasmid stability protein